MAYASYGLVAFAKCYIGSSFLWIYTWIIVYEYWLMWKCHYAGATHHILVVNALWTFGRWILRLFINCGMQCRRLLLKTHRLVVHRAVLSKSYSPCPATGKTTGIMMCKIFERWKVRAFRKRIGPHFCRYEHYISATLWKSNLFNLYWCRLISKQQKLYF